MRRLPAAVAIFCALILGGGAAYAENPPGITATQIKLGQTAPYSGLGSVLSGSLSRAEMAYFRMINDRGGVNGRKIDLISLDDAFDMKRAQALTKQLVEQDHVAAIFSTIGPQVGATRAYLNERGVPQLFIASSGDEASDPKHYPWTVGGISVLRIEAQIFGRYLLINQPNAKVGILYQADEFGEAYRKGLMQGFGALYTRHVAAEASFPENTTDFVPPLTKLKAAGVEAVVLGISPPYAVRVLKAMDGIGWHPLTLISSPSSSVRLLQPFGLARLKGLMTAASYMDPTDPRWSEDGSLKPYNDFLAKYLSGAEHDDAYLLVGYTLAQAMVQTLKQCCDDLSRENILAQATNLRNFHPIGVLPGISFFTSRTRRNPIVEAALEVFDGQHWDQVGEVMAGQ
jgi:ABC-type branched-subunit amino acid transport system substrate-binding protein